MTRTLNATPEEIPMQFAPRSLAKHDEGRPAVARGRALVAGILAFMVLPAITPAVARAQWVTTYEQFYLQAPHNWSFRNQYAHADRLFNAFDYGHAILYEVLWTKPGAPAAELEEKQYDFLTKKVLVRPPRVPLEEGAIEIRYAQLAPEAKAMFEWAHILHRQIYDVLADERLSDARKDSEVERLLAYYRSRPDLAFSSRPKTMELMQEQPYSLAFRQKYPKFNGLIWGYHWLQMGLYEPLVVGRTAAERQAGVRATVSRFWQMLESPPRSMPHQMPMTVAVAPRFAERFPEAAIIFDNLHSMHDVISDILANAEVPRNRKRAEIIRAANLYRDDTSYVMPVAAWRTMSIEMGAENMGGPAVGFQPELPTPTVTYGAVMQHDTQTGRMTGMKVGEMTGAHGDHAAHGATPDTGRHQAMQHDSMQHDMAAHAGHDSPAADSTAAKLREMHDLMLRDATIRARVLASPALRALQQQLEAMGAVDSIPRARAPAAKPPAKAPAKKPPAKVDPHAAHRPPPPPPTRPPPA
jgi:hypothetical protein